MTERSRRVAHTGAARRFAGSKMSATPVGWNL